MFKYYIARGNHSTDIVQAFVIPLLVEKKEINLQAALNAKISTNILTKYFISTLYK